MRFLAWKMLGEFAQNHPDCEKVLRGWKKQVETASWNSFAELRAGFQAVDSVGNDRYVFNIGGNKYRLVCAISFTEKIVLTKWIGTHAEYDRIDARTI